MSCSYPRDLLVGAGGYYTAKVLPLSGNSVGCWEPDFNDLGVVSCTVRRPRFKQYHSYKSEAERGQNAVLNADSNHCV